MSKKVIGIKQADGSFFPILKDGEPANKTLEVTTVRDGQTTVKINLYKQYEETSELEYVDTLLIENLVPHLKEEPSFKLSINLDEDNILAAEVLDPETGAKSDTSVSLVTLSEAQQSDSSDFELAENPEDFDDIGVSSLDLPDDFSSLADFDENSIENSVLDDDTDFSFEETEEIANTDLAVDEDLNFGAETETLDDALASFSMDDDLTLPDDFDLMEEKTENLSESNDVLDSFDISEPENGTEASTELDSFSFDDTSMETLGDDSFSDSLASDTLNIDGDDLSMPEDATFIDDFSLNETAGASEEAQNIDDTSFDSLSDDFTFPESTSLHDDLTVTDEPSDFSMEDSDDFSTDSLDLDGDFGTNEAEQDLSMDTDFDTSFETGDNDAFSDSLGEESLDLGDDAFTSDSLDLSTDSDSQAIDFNGDFDLDSTDLSMPTHTETSFSDDFDVGLGENDNLSLDSNAEPEMQYADFGTQYKSFEDTSTSFIPPLYDKKLKDDIEKKRSRRKYPLPMIICIICAIICIAAVVLAFAFGSWPGDNPSVVNNIVSVEPPQVFEQEKLEKIEEGIEVYSPEPEENTIEIVIEEEVVPVKPEPAQETKTNSINYKLIWGDTLWDLSDTYYRNPWLYDTIADANDIANPDYIIAGTYIEIPLQ